MMITRLSALRLRESVIQTSRSSNILRASSRLMSSREAAGTKRSVNDDEEDETLLKGKGRKAHKLLTRKKWGEEVPLNAGSYANVKMREKFGIELPAAQQADHGETATTPKRTKKRVAFLIGYLGTGYGGFQMNDEQKTIHAEFELAMLKCNYLLSQNFGFPNKYGWSTSGRTDKGVHACAQVCSSKIELLPDTTMDQVREEMNAVLPAEIRVLDVVRTTRTFCAKTQRDRVRYQYMLPSFALMDAAEVRKLFESHGCTQSGRDSLSPEEIETIRSQLVTYRIGPDTLERLRAALEQYVGTHSFHQFTKGVSSEEDRASRYILSFDASDPIVFDNGVEWIPTQVVGQSFMIHQIRKMVSLAMDVARGLVPLDTIPKALSTESSMRLNVAPASGLFLEMSIYSRYNQRLQNPDLDHIDWDDEHSAAHRRWKDFRHNVVMRHVVAEEAEESHFAKYLFVQEFVFQYKKCYQLE